LNTRNRRTLWFWGAGALAVAATVVHATGGGSPQAPSSPAVTAKAAAPELPAGLPPGEVQMVTERNGGRVIVLKAAQPTDVSGPTEGMRAYIDPTTGAFRGPELEDLQAEAAASAALRLRARAVEEQSWPVEGKAGGEYMRVDDSLMVYTVAQKSEEGSVAVDHAQGGQAAVQAVAQGAAKGARKDHRHDR
jgi:hypothetical protein